VNKESGVSHGYETDADVVLDVSNLNVAFRHEKQLTQAVRNLSFTLKRGETLAIVGESGSGKSVTAMSLLRLLEQAGGEVSCDHMRLCAVTGSVSIGDADELACAACAGPTSR
jgi:glutathione transport system ATP-binding protein